MNFLKSVNIWQCYKQERGCLMHFARLANTLLKDEESARDNHVLACLVSKTTLRIRCVLKNAKNAQTQESVCTCGYSHMRMKKLAQTHRHADSNTSHSPRPQLTYLYTLSNNVKPASNMHSGAVLTNGHTGHVPRAPGFFFFFRGPQLAVVK